MLRRSRRNIRRAREILTLHADRIPGFAEISDNVLGELRFLDRGVVTFESKQPIVITGSQPAAEEAEGEAEPVEEEKEGEAEAPLPDFSEVCPDGGEPEWDQPTVTVNLVGVLPKDKRAKFESQVTTDLDLARKIYRQAGIELKKGKVKFVPASNPGKLRDLADSELGDTESQICGSKFVKRVFRDMKNHGVSTSRSLKSPLIFYVENIGDARGWSCDVQDYAGINLGTDDKVLAHELGHILLKTDIHGQSPDKTIFSEAVNGTRMTLFDHIQPLRMAVGATTIFPQCK